MKGRLAQMQAAAKSAETKAREKGLREDAWYEVPLDAEDLLWELEERTVPNVITNGAEEVQKREREAGAKLPTGGKPDWRDSDIFHEEYRRVYATMEPDGEDYSPLTRHGNELEEVHGVEVVDERLRLSDQKDFFSAVETARVQANPLRNCHEIATKSLLDYCEFTTETAKLLFGLIPAKSQLNWASPCAGGVCAVEAISPPLLTPGGVCAVGGHAARDDPVGR